jgi:KipI family sensor histidine kinase inhibitor
VRSAAHATSALGDTVHMHARRVGQHGLLVECADAAEVAATYTELRARAADLAATDIVPAARTVLLDGLRDPEAVEFLIRDWVVTPSDDTFADAPLVELPVTYDGPDLEVVAQQWGVGVTDVVRIHRETEYVVAFCGFAPGFAYCTGLPEDLGVKRRSEPRSKVPAGSVALAGAFTAVYPTASPGGWQLIGTTTEPVWRPDSERPALLEPGTRVRFVDA